MTKQTLFTEGREGHKCAGETVGVGADQLRGRSSTALSTLVTAVAGVTRAGQGRGGVKASSFQRGDVWVVNTEMRGLCSEV